MDKKLEHEAETGDCIVARLWYILVKCSILSFLRCFFACRAATHDKNRRLFDAS